MPQRSLWSDQARQLCIWLLYMDSAGSSAGGVPERCRDWSGTCAQPLMLHGLPSQVRDAHAVDTLLDMP